MAGDKLLDAIRAKLALLDALWLYSLIIVNLIKCLKLKINY